MLAKFKAIPNKERTGKVTFYCEGKKKSPDPNIENKTGLMG